MSKKTPLKEGITPYPSSRQRVSGRSSPIIGVIGVFLLLSSCCCRGVNGWMSMSANNASSKRVVVVGGGIQGTSVAYQIKKEDPSMHVTILESTKVASAASGKGGGFMARSWGDGGVTQELHHVAFDMYEQLAASLSLASYRKLPVLSVRPGTSRGKSSSKVLPAWLDGKFGGTSLLGAGDDTAQVTPAEFVHAMLADEPSIDVLKGTCTGVLCTEDKQITGVKYNTNFHTHENNDDGDNVLEADVVIVSAGPWSCAAEDWFDQVVQLPMEGVKSTSIVWEKPTSTTPDGTALFCGEDPRFGTHLEVYPRPDGTIYICGIGGSDYISTEELKRGDFREENTCLANEARVQAASSAFQTMSEFYEKEGTLQTTQACMRPCPPDALPYMGKVPTYQGAFINAGHNCWGIAWAPACGKAMAELVCHGQSTTINLAPFNPARFTTKQTQRGRKKRGTNVGEQW